MPNWRRSSYCSTGTCVLIAFTVIQAPVVTVLARDGKVDDGPILRFDSSAWKDFVSGVKAGEFRAGGL
jgi:hypothetical protein